MTNKVTFYILADIAGSVYVGQSCWNTGNETEANVTLGNMLYKFDCWVFRPII